jgi:hypothetical protein
MYNYKEVFTHPTGRWLWLMQGLAGPGLIEGHVAPGAGQKVSFTNTTTGRTIRIDADVDGSFRCFLPQGEYRAQYKAEKTTITVLTGGTDHVNLRPGHAIDFALTSKTIKSGKVVLRLTASGDGMHTFEIRANNLKINQPSKRIILSPNQTKTIQWTASMLATDQPWIAVVIADDNVLERQDMIGSTPRFMGSPD